MVKNQSLEIEAVKGIVHAINECWRMKDHKGIGAYLADDVVVAPPGSGKRIHGRAAYLQSYQDFDQAAETLEFLSFDPQVDLVGDTAVAVCPFEVVYKLQDGKYHEKGQNILVFSFLNDRWKIVWRTMRVETIPENSDL